MGNSGVLIVDQKVVTAPRLSRRWMHVQAPARICFKANSPKNSLYLQSATDHVGSNLKVPEIRGNAIT